MFHNSQLTNAWRERQVFGTVIKCDSIIIIIIDYYFNKYNLSNRQMAISYTIDPLC